MASLAPASLPTLLTTPSADDHETDPIGKLPRCNNKVVVEDCTKSFAQSWAEAAEQYGDADALIFDGVGAEVRFTYRELEARSTRLARNLMLEYCLQEGDFVVTIADNRPELLTLLLACMKIGAVFVPLATDLRFADCRKIVNTYEPKLVVSDQKQYASFVLDGGRPCSTILLEAYRGSKSRLCEMEEEGSAAPLPPVVVNDKPSLIFSTSGSTGLPKGVVYSRKLMAQLADMGRLGLGMIEGSAGDKNLLWVHFRGAGGTLVCLCAIVTGVQQIMVDVQPNGPDLWAPLIEKHGITTMLLFGAAMNQFVQELPHQKFPGVKLLTYGGSCFPPALVQKSMEQFPAAKFRQMYGMTEAFPIASLPFDKHKRASEGGPADLAIMSSAGIPSCDVSIEDMDKPGSGLPPPPAKKGVGQVCAACTYMMSGYSKNPGKTEEALPDGKYMRTGDVGRLDEEGHLFILGRVKDIIPTYRGFNVAPRDIEEVMYSHPAVAEAQVVGLTHPCGAGDMVVAWAHAKTGKTITATDMRQHCINAGLPAWQVPEVFNISSESLPKNGGKLNKKTLQDPAFGSGYLLASMRAALVPPGMEISYATSEADDVFGKLSAGGQVVCEAILEEVFGDAAAGLLEALRERSPSMTADVAAWRSCLSGMPANERTYWLLQVGSLIATRDRAAYAA
eukprot:TRINITY_DN121134_c0_g1_i1.p1 TRINITY_DN121134_c0_g1~~TRINITY_DN121134_c0_g1_i1.p1  ORF type:complete len:676 (-),score=126.60 TRINITY_DN121134_c0_g1_i1:421-2448(-)